MHTLLNNLLLTALLAAAPAALHAQDKPAAPRQQQDDSAKQPQVKKENDGDSKAAKVRTVRDFKPSEEISEGLSVSFPSDI